MSELIKDSPILVFTMWALFLPLMGWVFLTSRLKNELLKTWITLVLILLFFIVPVLVKIHLTDGFMNEIADQGFIINYIQKYFHTDTFTDPLFKDVAPYYPPLFFYITAKIGQLLNIDNIYIVYNIGSLVFFSILMALLFNLLRRITENVEAHSRWFYLVFFLALFFVFFDFDFLYGKCYESLSFMLMLLVIYEIDCKREHFSTVRTGLLLGIIAMLYFYTLIIFAIAIVIYFFRTPPFKLSKFTALAGISLLTGSPYLFPLFKQFIHGIMQGGSSYVYTDISRHAFYPYIPDLNTVEGLIIFFSSAGFFWIFKGKYRFIKVQFLVIYSLYFLNLLAIAFLSRDMLITPRLWAWTKMLFYFTAVVFLKEFLVYLNNRFDREYMRKVTLSLLTIFAIVAFGGFFNSVLHRNKSFEAKVQSIRKTTIPGRIYSFIDRPRPQIISIYMHLGEREPFCFFLPNNLIYANPFADISGRLKYLESLTALEGHHLYYTMLSSPYGSIDGIVGKEQNGKIEFSTYTGMLISVQDPRKFEFDLSRFDDEYFQIKRIEDFTVIKTRMNGRVREKD
jgi:hypothetical protein